jgi:hypothetical protein
MPLLRWLGWRHKAGQNTGQQKPRFRPCLEILENRLVPSSLGAPTDIALSNQSATAGQPTLTAIGTFSTTDPNPGQSFTYSLSGVNAGLFAVDNSTGTLETNTIFLNTVQQFYQLDVQSTDTLGGSFTKTFTITINPSTSPPTDISLSNTTLSAGLPGGTTLGTLKTVDPNAGQSFSYSLGGPYAGLFTVDSTGTIKTAAVFLNTAPVTYSLQVQTVDTLNLSFTKTFLITVNPSTVGPTDISLSNQSVIAGQPAGTVIGVFGTSDPNAGQSFTYTLGGVNASAFAVDNTTGTLKTNGIFLNTTVQTVSLQVKSTDTFGMSFTKTFTITLNPSTTSPTDISLSHQSANAGQPVGTIVGFLGTTDPNSGQSFSYSVSGPDAGSFTVNNTTGALETSTVFQNHAVQTAQIQVKSTDTLGLSFSKTFSITINPSSTPPTDISLSNQSVGAGQPIGTIVGLLGTTDPNAGQSFTYSLSGPDAASFMVNNTTGALETSTVFQNSAVQTAQIQVQTTDTLGLTFSKTFTISINPSAAPPTNISLSNTSVTAYQPVGTAIGTLNTTDPNAGQSFTYAVSGTNAGLFQVDNTGTLRTSTVFQNTAVATYQVQIQTTDTLGLSFSKTFTITVNPSASLPQLAVTGSHQVAQVGHHYGIDLTATLTDANGHALSGVLVTFQTPTTGAGGTLSGGLTATTDSNGTVSEILTANTMAGTFSIGVQVGGGLVSASIGSLTNLAGPAAKVSFVKGPSTAVSNLIMAPVWVQLQDQYGNPVAQSGVPIQLSLAGTKLKGTLSRLTNVNGIAVFNNLSIIRPGTYVLTAQSSGLGWAVSDAFTVKVNPYLVRRVYFP